MALGSLNAGRAQHEQFESMRERIRLAANYPLSQAYPILAWVIENAVQRFSNTDQANTLLRQCLKQRFWPLKYQPGWRPASRTNTQRQSADVERESDDGTLLVSAGNRERALKFLHDWFAREVKSYLKICDQFFGPDDLEVLMFLRIGQSEMQSLHSYQQKHHDQEGIASPDDEYQQCWRRISDQYPPETEIVIVGI